MSQATQQNGYCKKKQEMAEDDARTANNGCIDAFKQEAKASNGEA